MSTQRHVRSANNYRGWWRLPQHVTPCHITLKPPAAKCSCTSSMSKPNTPGCMSALLRESRMATCYFPFMWCQPLAHKGQRGLALSASLVVWFCGLVLGWPLIWTSPLPPRLQGLQARTLWDRWVALLATQRGSSQRDSSQGLSSQFCALGFLFPQLWKVCLFHCASVPAFCASPSDSGAEVMLFKDGLGSEFKDLQASYLLAPDKPFHSSLPDSPSLLSVWAFPPLTVS